MPTAQTTAIWIFGVAGVGIVTALIANSLFALGWQHIHDGPLGFAGQLCILVCLWLIRRRRARR